jgi:predicted transcriptional regulator
MKCETSMKRKFIEITREGPNFKSSLTPKMVEVLISVKEALREHGRATKYLLNKEYDIPLSTAYKTLKALKDQGYVQLKEKGKEQLYELTLKGESFVKNYYVVKNKKFELLSSAEKMRIVCAGGGVAEIWLQNGEFHSAQLLPRQSYTCASEILKNLYARAVEGEPILFIQFKLDA